MRREKFILFASQITIFFKKEKQKIVSNIAKTAAKEKMRSLETRNKTNSQLRYFGREPQLMSKFYFYRKKVLCRVLLGKKVLCRVSFAELV